MFSRKRWSIATGLAVALSLCFALLSWGAVSGAVNLFAGWNLLGNSSSSPLDVTTFGNSAQVTTVWKWVPAKNNWAFYTPLQGDGGAAHAASNGYDRLTSINPGEGFWVNAKIAFTAQLPAGSAVTSGSYKSSLMAGWNLIAGGDSKTPSQFNQALSTAPPPLGSIPANLNTLWSWDAARANWYFYAPSLEASGGTALGDYIAGKGYLGFGTKTLDPSMGFWVNRSAPPASIALTALGASSAMPMSIVTLTGTGFDTTATTVVRFADTSQYSVDVRPVRVSSTSIAVSVPPYFNSTSAVFAPGTVSVKVIQTSGATTRISGELAGFQILDLPTPSAPAGAVTLNFLKSLQAHAIELQSIVAGTPLDSAALRSSLAGQASSLAPLITAVQSVVQTPSQRVNLGTLRKLPVDMGASELRQTDRLIIGVFQAWGNGATALAGTGGTAVAVLGDPLQAMAAPNLPRSGFNLPVLLAMNGGVEQWMIALAKPRGSARSGNDTRMQRNDPIRLAQSSSTQIPGQAEANAYTQCLLSSDPTICSAQPALRAPQANVPSNFPGAVSSSLAVVGAGLVAGVAITTLVLGGSVAATAGVLALSGYLAYATVFTGLAQIGIGGSLGQSTAGARQLVEGGVKQVNDFVVDTAKSIGVGAIAGETAGFLFDAYNAAKGVADAFEQTVSPAPATTTTTSTTSTTAATTSTTLPTTTTTVPTTSTTTQTTITTTASVTTTTRDPNFCINRYEKVCLVKAACNPPSDLITQNQCINGCIAEWLACQ